MEIDIDLKGRMRCLGFMQVTSSYGNNYHYSDHVESGQFAFTAAEQGDYMTCFWAIDHRPEDTVTIDFDWKTGIAAKDWPNVAKKGSVDVSSTRHSLSRYSNVQFSR